jgi:hypothetical protein
VILLIGIFQVSHLIAVAKKSSITFNTLIWAKNNCVLS